MDRKQEIYSCNGQKDCNTFPMCYRNGGKCSGTTDGEFKCDRKQEIVKYIKENRPNELSFLSPLVDDVVFLEQSLAELRQNPFVEIHPSDKTKQRATPSAKLYKELLQQYNNCLKLIILKAVGDESDEESPLRKYMKTRLEVSEK